MYIFIIFRGISINLAVYIHGPQRILVTPHISISANFEQKLYKNVLKSDGQFQWN